MNKHIGSTLTTFLDDEGIRNDVDLRTTKKVLADQIEAKMEHDHVTRTELAARMKTSRTVVNRLLDPSDTSFTLATLAKASNALGLCLLVSLEAKTTGRSKDGLQKRTRSPSGRSTVSRA